MIILYVVCIVEPYSVHSCRMYSSNKVDADIFDLAVSMARRSTMAMKHGTCIWHRTLGVLSCGYNYETHFMCHQWSIHSEVAALMNLKRQHRNKRVLDDAVMVVVRIGRDNQCRMSKPCEKCRQAITEAGIKKVFYSC